MLEPRRLGATHAEGSADHLAAKADALEVQEADRALDIGQRGRIGPDHTPLTPEQQAAAARAQGIERWSRRLAIGSFDGTPLEGRVRWPNGWRDQTSPLTVDGVSGHTVHIEVFVTDDAVAAQHDAAAERYDRELAEKTEREAVEKARNEAAARRSSELYAMDPPAVVVVDGGAFTRSDDGTFVSIADEGQAYTDWANLLDVNDLDDIGETYATRADFDAAMAEAGA